MKNFIEKKLVPFLKAKKALLFFGVEIILNIVIIVGLVFVIRTFIVSPFQVYGPSMCDTLNYINDQCERGYGEYIIVNKAVYQNFLGWQVGVPKRGDIIVFHPPHNEKEFYIKRIIGLGGETVKLKDGYVYIYNKEHPQGIKLNETYLNSSNQGNTRPYREENTVFEVPSGQYFVLGDNRVQSSDSRSCFKESQLGQDCHDPGTTAYLKPDHIEGKAWLVLWPLTKIGAIADMDYKL